LQSRHQEHGVQVCGVEVIETLQGYSGVHQRALHEDGCDASLRGCACITYAVVYTSACCVDVIVTLRGCTTSGVHQRALHEDGYDASRMRMYHICSGVHQRMLR